MTLPRRTALVCLLILAGPAVAQAPPLTPPPNPTELVRSWYRQLFNRDLDRGAARWINDLQRGVPPDQVLAQILASEEYYQLAGSTPEGFVRQLFDDFRGREPAREELRTWVRQVQARRRDEVALAFLREGPGPQPPRPPADADYFAELGDAIRQVHRRLEDLAEDIADELEGKPERDLVRRTEAVLDDLHDLQRVARPGVPRERMARAFDRFDRSLDGLLDAVRRAAGGRRPLQRAADRVAQADQRLHLAFHADQQPPARPDPALQRQADALLLQARQLRRTAGLVLSDPSAGGRILRNLDQFLDRAERFRGSAQGGADLQRLRRDFAVLLEPWGAAVRDINGLPPAGGFYILRLQAQRVEQTTSWLQRQLGVAQEVPYVVMPAGPRR